MTPPNLLQGGQLPDIAPRRDDACCARLGPEIQLFCVGGAVRDALLGVASSDHDFLVVGATPEAMVLAGFRPIGRDFPVFLHPQTQAQYALARTERKTGIGYHGFQFQADPSVRLEEDLLRRDLTINAMAVDERGQLHDPHHGFKDLSEGMLRHVSPAFEEDPVRLLRLARFMARWPWADVHEDTIMLCQSMVQAGEVDSLVAERVWQEFAKGLCEPSPRRLVALLVAVGAWDRIIHQSPPTAQAMARLDALAAQGLGAEIVAAVLWSSGVPPGLGHALPKQVHDWISLIARGALRLPLRRPDESDHTWANRCLAWCQEADLFRRPERLPQLKLLAEQLEPQQHPPSDTAGLVTMLEALLETPVGALAKAAQARGDSIPEAVAQGRRQRLIALMQG